MRGLLPLALLVPACTSLLGLDPTIDDRLDTDHDGVLDTLDNCRGTHNPDQADGNGDGAGDSCDLCGAEPFLCETGERQQVDVNANCVDDGCERCEELTAADEDGDGVLDGCDLCPPIADASQADLDGDGISDPCDAGGETAQQRLYFDGFNGTEFDIDLWKGSWTIDDGAAVPVTGALRAMRAFVGAGSTGDWSMLIGIEPGFAGTIGIEMFSSTNPVGVSCTLAHLSDSTHYTLVGKGIAHGSSPVDFTDPGVSTIPLRMFFESEFGPGFACELVGLGARSTHIADDLSGQPDLRVEITAPKGARIQYAFAVD